MSKVILAETTKFLLFVNDNLAINQDRFKKLINHGVVIASARSTAKALELLGRAQYDAVLSDLRRVEHGRKNDNAGIELTLQIRRNNPHIPIFIYSINIDFATRQFALSGGATLVTDNPAELESGLRKYGLLGSSSPGV